VGIEGTVQGHELWLGSRQALAQYGTRVPELSLPPGGTVHLAIDGQYRGTFVIAGSLRADLEPLLASLRKRHELALLSGDNNREYDRFRALFGTGAELHFQQSPLDKLTFVRARQHAGHRVLMVGDGLNDAGALQQSDVGVAVVDQAGAFSPASDVILDAAQLPKLNALLGLSRRAVRIVRGGFIVSAAYNVVGIGVAAAGWLSPLFCAVVMPLSSLSVVLFACGLTSWSAHRLGLTAGPGSPRK